MLQRPDVRNPRKKRGKNQFFFRTQVLDVALGELLHPAVDVLPGQLRATRKVSHLHLYAHHVLHRDLEEGTLKEQNHETKIA
jgi:hypothetical protein